MKTKQIVEVYKLLNEKSVKLTKMDDKDKFMVIRLMKQMKPVETGYEDFVKDAQEKLKDERFDEMAEKAKKWQEEGDNTTMTVDERVELNTYFIEYNKKVNECVKEELEKEVELKYERLSEDAFGKLLSSNDFDLNAIMVLNDALC